MRHACIPIALIAATLAAPTSAQTTDQPASPATPAAPAVPPIPGTAEPVKVDPAADNPAGATVDAPVMSLEEAVDMALKNNELIGQNEAGTRKARARAREVGANNRPQVRVSGQYLRQKEVVGQLPTKFDPETGMPIAFTQFTLSPAYTKTAAASVSQLIDIFGTVRKAKNIANLSARIQALNVERSRSEVIYEARTAYYNVLRAMGAVDVAQASLNDAEEQLRLAQAFVAAGTSPQFDVTRAQVTVADRRQTLITAQDNAGLAGAALNNVLGRPVETPLNLAPIAGAPDRNVDITAQTERAMEARPEILQADLGIRASETNVDLQRIGRYPTFSATANYNYNFNVSGFSSDKANWNFGVGVSWPLYQGGAVGARVEQAQADVQSSQLGRDQLRRAVALDVRQSGLRVQEAADRYAVAEEAVSLAEEALRLARVRYQNGVSTQLEVTDAETQLTQARFNRVNTLYDYLTARANFDASVLGRLPNPYSGAAAAGSSSTGTTSATSSLSAGAASAGGVTGSFNSGATGAGASQGGGF